MQYSMLIGVQEEERLKYEKPEVFLMLRKRPKRRRRKKNWNLKN
jgi:hypothetical protein